MMFNKNSRGDTFGLDAAHLALILLALLTFLSLGPIDDFLKGFPEKR